MKTKTQIYIKSTFAGFHRWANAPIEVGFLRNYHRHIFHVRLSVEVSHQDRDIEFFTLKAELDEMLNTRFESAYFDFSCEHLAEMIIIDFVSKGYAVVACEVSEDDENGAIVTVVPNE